MYSGVTLKPFKYFDAWFGAHQKIDRVARRHLSSLFQGRGYYFPPAKQITRFEGIDGPDGIKRKTPGRDEPRHYYDPHDPNDERLLEIIEAHYTELVAALQAHNEVRAAFEASWLAHAIVDGLTPAHHYPYEEELMKLRGGEAYETRNSVKEQLVLPGETLPKKVRNNWKMWGDKGLLATHFAFEWGIAVMILPMRLKLARPDDGDRVLVRRKGVGDLFKLRAEQVAQLAMYETFYKSGWTPKLAKQARRELVPLIVNALTLVWYSAIMDAQSPPKRRQRRAT